MNQTHPKPIVASFRMFPRLAAKPATDQPAPRRRVVARERRQAVARPDSPGSTRAQLRVRLLRMITENERNRRHEPHAS